MSKRSDSFELVLGPRDPRQPAYHWLESALRRQILAGRLRPGMRLPATRDLAAQHLLSRGTIVRAFEELKAEGYLQGNIGSGTYVSRVIPEDMLASRAEEANPATFVSLRRYRLSHAARRANVFTNFENRPSRAFRANLPAIDLFPTELWAKISSSRLRRVTRGQLFLCEAMGYPPLRRAIADYLTSSRGVRCTPEQVAIVSGMQEALDLAARLFLDPGDRVCVEDPGYPGAHLAFRATGARVIPVALDAEGIRFDPKRLHGARIVYLTPAHQFPLGITMSLARRLQFLEWARKQSALLFEDDYDSEYRYSGSPVPSMQGLDSGGSVVFAGSFSKVLFPSLRLGYMVIPSPLIERMDAMLSITRRHAPLLDQAILCDFIDQGHFGRHLRRMRTVYAERLSVLLEESRSRLTGLLEVSNVQAGLQTAATLTEGLDAESAAVAAAARGVDVTPVSHYRLSHAHSPELQLGFAAFEPREIRRGVRELAIALEAEMQRTAKQS